jgi:hypothetical protein
VNFSAQLAQGIYRLTLLSGLVDAIVDQAGNALDGDANGSAAGNFVRNFQLDLTGPTVVSVAPSGAAATGPNQFVVMFQENLTMNAATVTNVANYSLLASIDEVFGNLEDTNESSRITGVVYDASTKTATVTLSGALPARHYQFIIRPTVTDQAGNALGAGVPFVSLLDVGVPVLSPIGNRSVFDSVLTTFTATATDPDGGSLIFSLAAGAPQGASITPAGVFTWTPTEAQAGNVYNIKVIVTDNNIPALTDSETIAITVVFNPAPVLVSATINDGFAQRSRVSSIVLQFSENVSSSLGASDLIVTNLSTGAAMNASSMSLAFDAVTNRARLTFPGLVGQQLADGTYRIAVSHTSVTDANGKALSADFSYDFLALTGDANGDGITNDVDLYLVFRNLAKPPASRNLNEDLNGDGQVTSADTEIVKGNYLAAVPPPLAPAPMLVQSINTNNVELPLASNTPMPEFVLGSNDSAEPVNDLPVASEPLASTGAATEMTRNAEHSANSRATDRPLTASTNANSPDHDALMVASAERLLQARALAEPALGMFAGSRQHSRNLLFGDSPVLERPDAFAACSTLDHEVENGPSRVARANKRWHRIATGCLIMKGAK